MSIHDKDPPSTSRQSTDSRPLQAWVLRAWNTRLVRCVQNRSRTVTGAASTPGTQVAADLDGQLTRDGVAGERSDLCDLRPGGHGFPGFGDPAVTQARPSCTCWRMAWSASSRGASWRPSSF